MIAKIVSVVLCGSSAESTTRRHEAATWPKYSMTGSAYYYDPQGQETPPQARLDEH
jgi:hypothetical protein